MGRTKDEVLKEFRTAEILGAARKVFAARGYHEATVEAVAEEAGVAEGTIYLYYGSKRELYGEALKQGILELYEETKRRVDQAATWKKSYAPSLPPRSSILKSGAISSKSTIEGLP
jgi:AcrR family transcriptional regulator